MVPPGRSRRARALLRAALLLPLLACGDAATEQPRPLTAGELPQLAGETVAQAAASDAAIEALVESEERILLLAPVLARLDASALNLQLPDHRSFGLFDAEVAVWDLAAAEPARDPSLAHDLAVRRRWSI